MRSTLIQGSQRSPFASALDHYMVMRQAAREYERVVTTLERLTPAQWSCPTDCSEWDVRAMAGHILGMTQMAASILEMMRQQLTANRYAKRHGGFMIDALTALQVEKNASFTSQQIVATMRAYGPKPARGRAHTPGFIRRQTVVQEVDGLSEWWTIGFLMDTILTRDPFMHRIDIAQATGVLVPVTAEHEGMIVDDVVHEWAQRHGAAYDLELTGPAGGTWADGDGAARISMDAFDFCRALSGRTPSSGLLSQQVPF